MATIYSHSPRLGFQWFKKGLALYQKQFIRFSLLFMGLMMVLSFLISVPLIGILLSIVSASLSQMLLFNASFGTRSRGFFKKEDLFQKLRGAKVWSRLLLASLVNTGLIYLILEVSLPTLPISTQDFLNLPPETMAAIVQETYSFNNLLPSLLGAGLYSLLSLWVYPLICWEERSVLSAFFLSLKASMSNALPLSVLVGLFLLIGYIGIHLLSLIPYTFVLFFIANTLIVSVYLCFFTAYMDIFYYA